MNRDELIAKFKAMPWEMWLHRRFPPFVTYLMMVYATPAGFKSQGLDGQFPFSLYDTDDWYGTPEMFSAAAKEAEHFLKQKDIFVLTRQCEDILATARVEIPKLYESPLSPRESFEKALSYIKPGNVYIWVAHASEAYYLPRLREVLKPYVPAEELETFIGDISFPSKKNALALLEEDARAGFSTDDLHKKYSWIKARGGFVPGYSLEEMESIRNKALGRPSEHRHRPNVPESLQSLAREAQELVYLRTLRTDALYEMYFLAQPIFDRYAQELGIGSLGDYIPDELLAGKINKIPHEHAIIKDNEDILVLSESIISFRDVSHQEVKGVVAYKGFAKGTVRIVHTPLESQRVENGDILVTNMTTPAYISAMHRAAAFVTNEGGITCHAAILARELKKPCITGTKIATKVLYDGDIVEVDAEKGIVRIIETYK